MCPYYYQIYIAILPPAGLAPEAAAMLPAPVGDQRFAIRDVLLDEMAAQLAAALENQAAAAVVAAMSTHEKTRLASKALIASIDRETRRRAIHMGDVVALPASANPHGTDPPEWAVILTTDAVEAATAAASPLVLAHFRWLRTVHPQDGDYDAKKQEQLSHIMSRMQGRRLTREAAQVPGPALTAVGSCLVGRQLQAVGPRRDVILRRATAVITQEQAVEEGRPPAERVIINQRTRVFQSGTAMDLLNELANRYKGPELRAKFEAELVGRTVVTSHGGKERPYRVIRVRWDMAPNAPLEINLRPDRAQLLLQRQGVQAALNGQQLAVAQAAAGAGAPADGVAFHTTLADYMRLFYGFTVRQPLNVGPVLEVHPDSRREMVQHLLLETARGTGFTGELPKLFNTLL